ncbi:MAG: rhomboid family intramembrane serine protease [Oscillospiraceae bacterium]|nr:rhomboid family intramembrane serine protease [Oscillospiraceae bacterium]
MKDFRRRFERFCYRNRNKGIPNLMLWIAIGNIAVFFLSTMDRSNLLARYLLFDPAAIMHGQVWRLVTYLFTSLIHEDAVSLVLSILFLMIYYQMGNTLERSWGRFRFNLYYLSGVFITDIAALIFQQYASIRFLNLSLFLAYATLYPETHFLVMWILPVKARWLALLDLAITAWTFFAGLIRTPTELSYLFPVLALANYLLFFGKDIQNLFPLSWQVLLRKKRGSRPKTVPFPAGGQKARSSEPYMHKCTVCGRTDITNPELEFRYCSKCNGYYCYCAEHISNHTHIQ